MYGWEIVCPAPIGRAASSYARPARPFGTKSSRGTRAIASSTRSSRTSRLLSWYATIWRRSSCGSGNAREPGRRIRRRPNAKVLENRGRDVDDRLRLGVEADRQHRHLGVRSLERAVTAAAEVAPARKTVVPQESWRDSVLYFVLVFLVIAGTSNGVNLTDGLDGLAAGCCASCGGTTSISGARPKALTPPRNPARSGDFGDLAVGDRWADLAVASLSLDWNFGPRSLVLMPSPSHVDSVRMPKSAAITAPAVHSGSADFSRYRLPDGRAFTLLG